MNKSDLLFLRAQNSIPGGVNSPVRAFKSVGGHPIYIKSAHGARLIDVEDKVYLDYIGAWGPMILGHGHPAVMAAMQMAMQTGVCYGAPCELEILLAEKICRLMPNLQKVRMLNSGTEATMTAIRLARAATKRSKIIKFSGCFHGHSDALLVKAGSGLLTLGLPSTPGIPENISQNTLIAPYNDLESVAALFQHYPDEIAGIIVEPVAGNMGLVLPQTDFLQGLRQICDQNQAVLIFDEVMTGFRVALGGAQTIYDVSPDLTTLGKIIGGGSPIGGLGGRAEIMDLLSPLGPVYQSGTFAGNPLTMAMGLATLEQLEQPEFYAQLQYHLQLFQQGFDELTEHYHIPMHAASVGGMFGIYCSSKGPITCYEDVARGDEALFKRFFHGMLKAGIYLAPSMYEAGFISSAHNKVDIEMTLAAVQQVFEHEQKIS